MAAYEVFAEREREGWADPVVSQAYASPFSPHVEEAGEHLIGGGGAVGEATDPGLDFSPAQFVEGIAQDLPFADASFDAVFRGFGPMHIPDQPKATAQVARVLAAAGRALECREKLDHAWHFETPEGLFDLYSSATVSAALRVKGQAEDRAEAMPPSVVAVAQSGFQAHSGYAVPVRSGVAFARRH